MLFRAGTQVDISMQQPTRQQTFQIYKQTTRLIYCSIKTCRLITKQDVAQENQKSLNFSLNITGYRNKNKNKTKKPGKLPEVAFFWQPYGDGIIQPLFTAYLKFLNYANYNF